MVSTVSHLPTLSTLFYSRFILKTIMMNLLKAFGIEEATDKLYDEAGIARIDWQRITDETIKEIETADVARDCIECSGEASQGSSRCYYCGIHNK